MNTRLKTLSRGIIDVSPLMIPVIPFGIIYGVIGMELGLGAYMTFGMSIIIFGGASQIVLLPIIFWWSIFISYNNISWSSKF